MSAGHRHDGEKASSGLADRYYEAAKALVAACIVIRTYDQPWLANRSTDARRVYVDRRVPAVLKSGIDTGKTLPWHELSEWLAMNDGLPYDKGTPSAHCDVATPLERRAVEAQKPGDPDIWRKYTEEMDGYITEVDEEKIKHVAPDQDLRQFEDDDRRLMERIIATQRGIVDKALTFAEALRKDATATGVHAVTAIGNERRGRRTAKPFSALIAGDDADPDDGAVDKRGWSTSFVITKADPDQRLIFGWASVVEKDGIAVIDKQGDVIPAEELEKAAYDFVLFSRRQGDMHDRTGVGRMVESMVFTREKQAALGIDLKKVAWWVGFRVDDDGLWAAHKRGERPEFSIGGAAVPVEIA